MLDTVLGADVRDTSQRSFFLMDYSLMEETGVSQIKFNGY